MTENDAPLMLSISGMRGIVGRTVTPQVVARYAAAFGSWLREQGGEGGDGEVVVARDSRPSGAALELAAMAGLSAVGLRVVRAGILSTPGAAVLVRHRRALGGLVVTASHNPAQWNGIKALRHDGLAPPPEQAQQIIARFHDDSADYVTDQPPPPFECERHAARIHRDAILPYVDADLIRAAKLTAVVDCVHGAGGAEALALLDALGVRPVRYYAEPTGEFPHDPEPSETNLSELCRQVPQHRAHVGFAQDPDADRLAIVDERGRYIGEEYSLALAALHVLREGQTVVANVSTSRMIDDVAARVGARVVRTAVGEANVASAMREHEAVIGGEGNGGVILPQVSYVRDSLVGMALVLELLARRGQPLSEIVDELPRYVMLKQKLPIATDVAGQLEPLMRGAFDEGQFDTRDGVRVDLDDGWVHVRASNTEPVLRLIAEAPDEQQARRLIGQVQAALEQA